MQFLPEQRKIKPNFIAFCTKNVNHFPLSFLYGIKHIASSMLPSTSREYHPGECCTLLQQTRVDTNTRGGFSNVNLLHSHTKKVVFLIDNW